MDAMGRRDFLKEAALLGVSALGAGVMAGTPAAAFASEGSGNASASASGSAAGSIDYGTDWNYDADVIVIGGGGAGFCAAIEASAAGSDVLILEKCAAVGGNSKLCGGVILCAGAQVEKDLLGDDYSDTPEAFADQMLRWSEGFGNPDMIREACMSSGDAADWMVSLGREYNAVEIIPPIWSLDTDADIVQRSLWNNTTFSGGHFAPLEQKMATLDNVQIMTDVEVTHLVRDETGAVIGVEALDGTNPMRAKAHKAVILACASVDNNMEMARTFSQQQYWGLTMRAEGLGNPLTHDMNTNTGDGIRMAMEAGAALMVSPACIMNDAHYLGGVGEYTTAFDHESNAYHSYKAEGTIAVNSRGRRYVQEDAEWGWVVTQSYKQIQEAGWIPQTNEVNVHILCDADHLWQWQLKGIDPSTVSTIVSADTIEELAEKIGVPPENLTDEIDKWNGYCDAGVDLDWGRRVDFGTLETPPFYADILRPGVLGTAIGVKTDTDTEVIDVNGNPIPRLYAAGLVAGGNFVGAFYPGCGWAILNTVVWGRKAGQIASALDSWDGENGSTSAQAASSAAPASYKDGTYTGSGTGMGGKINVTLEIKGGTIAVTDISPNNETQGIGGYEAIEGGTFKSQIETAQNADIEGVSGASITTAAIRKAVAAALAQAAE